MIPSTSFQVWISSAFIALPIIVAVRSEPPRPSVVMSPFLSLEMKPVTIGISLAAPSAYEFNSIGMFFQTSSKSSAAIKFESLTIPKSQASKKRAGVFSLFKKAAIMRTLRRSPKETK